MNESLRELVAQTALVENMLIDTSGEITPEIEALLANIETKMPAKIDGYQLFLERMDHISAFYEAKAEQMARMADAAEKLKKKLKGNIEHAMLELKIDEIQGVDYRFKLQKSSPAVVIESEEIVPESYKTIKQTTVVDKKRIKDDLALGVPVQGCRLEQGFYIRSYVNKAK